MITNRCSESFLIGKGFLPFSWEHTGMSNGITSLTAFWGNLWNFHLPVSRSTPVIWRQNQWSLTSKDGLIQVQSTCDWWMNRTCCDHHRPLKVAGYRWRVTGELATPTWFLTTTCVIHVMQENGTATPHFAGMDVLPREPKHQSFTFFFYLFMSPLPLPLLLLFISCVHKSSFTQLMNLDSSIIHFQVWCLFCYCGTG